MRRLVADTGPLLHLHEAAAIHLLPKIGEVFLSPLVSAELRSFVSAMPPDWAKVQSLSRSSELQAAQWHTGALLHAGEAQALALAVEIKADWFLTD